MNEEIRELAEYLAGYRRIKSKANANEEETE